MISKMRLTIQINNLVFFIEIPDLISFYFVYKLSDFLHLNDIL